MVSNRTTEASKRLPRVLQVITHLDLGGAEAIAISLAEVLHDRVETAVFAVMGEGNGPVAQGMAARIDGLRAVRHNGTALPFKRGGLLQAGMRLATVIREIRPDLVHLHTELPEAGWAVASRISSEVRATPVLRTIHNVRLWPQWRLIGRSVERHLGDRYAVAVSNDALEGLAQFRRSAGLRPMPAGGTQVIFNGVAPAPNSHRHKPAGAVVRVLFAGRLEHQKGADLLPEIWSQARAQTAHPAELTVMGAGGLARTLQAAFRGDPSVHMVPPAPGLAGVLSDFDVLLMPSRFEGFGLVAVEAILAGLPVIGFEAPGLREVFSVNYRGLAPLEDIPAIAQLLADAIAVPKNFRDTALQVQIAARFGIARMAAEYEKLYAELIEARI